MASGATQKKNCINQAILTSRLVNNIFIIYSDHQNVASGRRIFGVGLNSTSIHLWRRGAGETNCRKE